MKKEFKMPGQGKIDAWKKEHGTIHKLTVKVPGQADAICIVRAPKVSDISRSSTLGNGDEFLIGKNQLESCWLDGDERIKSRLAFTQAAAIEMGRIFEVYPWEVETIEVTSEVIAKLTAQGVDPKVVSKVSEDQEIKQLTILNGRIPILKEGKDTREQVVAFFQTPDLSIKEKADLSNDFLDQGNTYINECFLYGDVRFKDHSDEHIAFASYMSGHLLLDKLTAEVTKL